MQNKTFRETLMDLPKEKLVEVITGKDMEAASCCPHDFGLDAHHGYQHCLSVGNCTACWDREAESNE